MTDVQVADAPIPAQTPSPITDAKMGKVFQSISWRCGLITECDETECNEIDWGIRLN
jgi:hypothetical protein